MPGMVLSASRSVSRFCWRIVWVEMTVIVCGVSRIAAVAFGDWTRSTFGPSYRRVGDDDALQPRGVALIGGGRILGGGGKRYGRRNEADAAEREERSRSAVRLTIGLDHDHPFWSQNQSCRMLMRAIRM